MKIKSTFMLKGKIDCTDDQIKDVARKIVKDLFDRELIHVHKTKKHIKYEILYEITQQDK